MSHDDDAFGSALWLAAGGAAGYAAGRLLVAPRLATSITKTPPASSSPAPMLPPTKPALRALAAGPSGDLFPIDPYAGSSASSFAPMTTPAGNMQPIDPYVDSAIPLATPRAPIVRPTIPAYVTSGPSATPPQLEVNALPFGPGAPSATGPITRPSQVDPLPLSGPFVPLVPRAPMPPTPTQSASFATSARVRRFDPVFQRYRGTIPIEYVRALVERESDGQASVRAGSAIGLMQIVPVVLTDYNKRHGSAYTREYLANPAINVAIGCELLRIILQSYRANHPKIRTLQTDWDNPRFVELLTLGWNAGFSEAGGLGRVARYLEGLGAVDMDIDQVCAHAHLAGATKHLSNPAKIAWCKSVAALYQRERALRPRPTAS